MCVFEPLKIPTRIQVGTFKVYPTSTNLNISVIFFPPYSSYSFSKPNWELANWELANGQSPSLSLILERTHSPPYPSASNIPTGESSHSFSQLRKKQKKTPACGARGACPPATPKHSHRSGSGRGGGKFVSILIFENFKERHKQKRKTNREICFSLFRFFAFSLFRFFAFFLKKHFSLLFETLSL